MVPSTYEAGKLYNVLPSGNRAPDSTGENSGYDQTRADFDFDRGSNAAATRVNADGLIEKYRENKLLQSNQFDTSWLNVSSTDTSGQAGYDGTNNAWKLEKFASAARIYQNITYSGVNTFSIYVKAGTLNWVMINNGTNSVFFDIQNGAVGANIAGGGSVDASIEAVGAIGWYRVSVVSNVSASVIRIYPAQADNDFTGTSGSIYIQNAQLESGLVATDYLESTSVTGKAGVLIDLPRIDYSSGAGALLLEPSRANLIQYSEYFEGSYWNTNSNALRSLSSNLSPDGTANAYRVEAVSGTQVGYVGVTTIGTTITHSVYVRRISGSTTFDMVDVNNVSTQVDITNDWKRFSVTASATSTNLRSYLRLNQIGDVVEIFGFQAEIGSYATSYIPNHGESGGVTRAGDSCSVTGASDVIGQTEGTMFFELKDTNDFNAYLGVDSGSTGTRILIYGINDQKVYAQVRNSSTVIFGSTSSVISGGAKCAVAFNSSGSVFYVNGTQIGSGSGTTFTNLSQVTFNHSSVIGAKIKQTALFKERLTNEELATLTTL